MPDTLFDLGSVVMTRGVKSWYEDGFNPFPYIQRHARGDWGDELGEDDKRRNDEAVEKGLRILSAYDTEYGKMWIITEADRSVTTLLTPKEY